MQNNKKKISYSIKMLKVLIPKKYYKIKIKNKVILNK